MTTINPDASAQHYRWVILIVATIAQAAACFFVQGIGAIAVFLQRDLALDTMQIGALMSAAQVVPLIGLLVAGELLDKYGERPVVGLGTLIVGLALMAASFSQGYHVLLLALLVVGAGYSTVQPGGSKSISSWFGQSQRGLAMGIRQAGLPLGGALAAATLPFAAVHWGWRATFLIGGTVALAGAAIFMLFYRSAPAEKSAAPPLPKLGWREALRSRMMMAREPAMRAVMTSGLSLISVQYGILIFSALYIQSLLQLPPTDAALLLFIAQGAGACGRIVLASWSDHCKAGRILPVVICMGAVIAGLVLFMWFPIRSWPLASLLMAWLGFFGFGWYGPWVAYVAEIAPPGKTGFALGLAMSVNQIAAICLPPLLGLLKDQSRSFLPVWSLLIGLTVIALMFMAKNRVRAMRER